MRMSSSECLAFRGEQPQTLLAGGVPQRPKVAERRDRLAIVRLHDAPAPPVSKCQLMGEHGDQQDELVLARQCAMCRGLVPGEVDFACRQDDCSITLATRPSASDFECHLCARNPNHWVTKEPSRRGAIQAKPIKSRQEAGSKLRSHGFQGSHSPRATWHRAAWPLSPDSPSKHKSAVDGPPMHRGPSSMHKRTKPSFDAPRAVPSHPNRLGVPSWRAQHDIQSKTILRRAGAQGVPRSESTTSCAALWPPLRAPPNDTVMTSRPWLSRARALDETRSDRRKMLWKVRACQAARPVVGGVLSRRGPFIRLSKGRLL